MHANLLLFQDQEMAAAWGKVYPRNDDDNEGKKKKRTPKGHFVVYVGEEMERFVLPTAFLKKPSFQQLLKEAEEVYGFHSQKGIVLPCHESTLKRVIEHILRRK